MVPIQAPSGVLVDVSNLHVGGGVQVASSLISELVSIFEKDPPGWLEDLTVSASTAVTNYSPLPAHLPFRFVTEDRSFRHWPKPDRRWKVALTLFGPAYRRRIAETEIVGIALPYLGYRLRGSDFPPWQRLKLSGLGHVKSFYLRDADVVVVESDHFRTALASRGFNKPTVVISNAPSSKFLERLVAMPLRNASSRFSSPISIAVVARGYTHKNLDFLPSLAKAIQSEIGEEVIFHVTLSLEEWNRRTSEFHRVACNHGVVDTNGLVEIYMASHIAVLPTLLEVSSVTPYEALAVGLPTFVSDRPFMRAQLGQAASYFDPTNPTLAAKQIVNVLQDEQEITRLRQAGADLVGALPTAQARANAYLELIRKFVV